MSDTILTLDRLCVGYGDRPAAADVSFSLQRGEILCLVGVLLKAKFKKLRPERRQNLGPEREREGPVLRRVRLFSENGV